MSRLHLTPTVQHLPDPSAPGRTLATISIGEGTTHNPRVYLAEPTDRQDSYGLRMPRYVFWFGAHAETYVAARGRGIEDAFETAAEYALARWPGLGCADTVSEEYNRGISEGLSEDAARERAEIDTTAIDGGGYLISHEWGIVCGDRHVDRSMIEDLCYPTGTLRHASNASERWPMYQPTRAQYLAPVVRSHAELWSDVVVATLAAGRSERGTCAILSAIGDM